MSDHERAGRGMREGAAVGGRVNGRSIIAVDALFAAFLHGGQPARRGDVATA